jgi:dihydrolipoamide dehydrogenase
MSNNSTQLVVIGAGPGGYPAAFLAADLGMDVTLVDMEANPGGVCLYRGCIPSKALLHASKLLADAREAAEIGIQFGEPKIDIAKLRTWKESVVGKLTGGLGQLSKVRKVKYIQGRARFLGPDTISIKRPGVADDESLTFQHALLATGSRPAVIPNFPVDPSCIWDSTAALSLDTIPSSLLVVGGGYIGLELGSVYASLGSQVTVVEMMPGLLPGADRDLVTFLSKRLKANFKSILLNTRVVEMTKVENGVRVKFEGQDVKEPEQVFEKVLVSVGRKPNTGDLGLENTKVQLDAKGFVKVNPQRQTDEPSIYAIGDIAGEPMLAHKATHEGRLAIEAIAGHKVAFEPRAIPAVVFTDPEIAWCGLTETQAKAEGREVKVAKFPWGASGRATTLNRNDGVTKLIVDPADERVLGVGITGPGAGDMIAEAVLAIEMGAVVSDLKLTIHPHPTLSETVMEAAEVFFNQSPHFYQKK